MLERDGIRQQDRSIGIGDDILGEPTVGGNARHVLVLAESNIWLIRGLGVARCPTSGAFVARMPEVEHADSLPGFPLRLCLLSNSDDCTGGLVGRSHRTRRFVNALVYLVVRVAEACRADFDEQVIVTDRGDGNIM